MNWDAIAAISQAFGTIAVIVTLIYIALQVRRSRQQASRSLSQGRNEALRELAVKWSSTAYFRLTRLCELRFGVVMMVLLRRGSG